MPDADPYGPEVDRKEDLYRAIITSTWWIDGRDQPLSSAAFSWPTFSVNIESLMTFDEAVRHLRAVLKCPKGGLALFNCGRARDLGFDPRKEPDPNHPENQAHANVYSDGADSKRKTRAKKLAQDWCRVVLKPSFRL
jgi:hypothetical protein